MGNSSSRVSSTTGSSLPSSPSDCVQRLRSYDKQTRCATSFQIVTKEYTQLHSVAAQGGTTELIKLFCNSNNDDFEGKIHFLALSEMLTNVPAEVNKMATNFGFFERILFLFSNKNSQQVFDLANKEDVSIFISFLVRYFVACETTNLPITSALTTEQRKKLILCILSLLATQSTEHIVMGLVIIHSICSGICAQIKLPAAMQKTAFFLLELPLGEQQLDAHLQVVRILQLCAEEDNDNLHEWFPPYSGTYFPRLVNLLAQKGIDITKDNSLVVLTTGVYLSAAVKLENIAKDGKFIVAWANLVVQQKQVPKLLRTLICLMFLAHSGVPHLQTAFAVIAGSFSLRCHEKQQKFLVILCALLFRFAELDTEENTQKLIFIIDTLTTLYGTPQMTVNKLVLISELLVAVQCKKETSLPEREYSTRLGQLIPAAMEKLQALIANSSPDIKSVKKLLTVICTSEDYLATIFTTPSMRSLLNTLLQHHHADVVVCGFALLGTWTNKTDWTVWSPVVISSYLPIIAQKLASPNSPVFNAAVGFLRSNISTLHQAQQLLPPAIHNVLAKGCVSQIPQTATMFTVFVDMLRVISLIDTTKRVLVDNGALTLVVEQIFKIIQPSNFKQAKFQSLLDLFLAIDEETFTANPPSWSLVINALLSITPSNLTSSEPLIQLIQILSGRSSCALAIANNDKARAHLFTLLSKRPIDKPGPYHFILNMLCSIASWGHFNKQMLPDNLLAVLIQHVDPAHDDILQTVAMFLWDVSNLDGILETVVKNHYAAISTIFQHLENLALQSQDTIKRSRFACCGLLGKLVEKGLLNPVDKERALKCIHEIATTPPGEACNVVFNIHVFKTCFASWMTPDTPTPLQELLLWTLVSFKAENANLVDSLQSALAHGTLLYALKITLIQKPPPLLHSLALQHISFVWAPSPTDSTRCSLSLRKKSEALVQKTQPTDSDFAIEDINRVEAAHIKELSSHPTNSEGRNRVQSLIEHQYELLDEFAPPHTQSQIIAICLHGKSTPLAPLVISIGCKKEPSPSEYGQLSATVAEWKRKFAAGRKGIILSLQPFFVQSMLKVNAKVSSTSLMLDAAKPDQLTSTTTSLVVRAAQTQLITSQFNSISLNSDPSQLNPKASLQRCSVCSLPLRGVTEASLKYADVTTLQQVCPTCAKSKDKIAEAYKEQNSGNWQDAFQIWEALNKSNQAHPFFFTQMAFCAFKNKNYERAHTAAERAVKMKDEDPSGHLWNIFYYSKLGTGRIMDAARSVFSSANVPATLVADIRGQVKMVLKEEINFAKSKKALTSVCDELSLEATTLGIDL